jgi:hypothetical protein
MTVYRRNLLRMMNVSGISCGENKNLFIFLNHAVYKRTWESIVEPGRSHMTIWRMHIAWWIPMSTNTLGI